MIIQPVVSKDAIIPTGTYTITENGLHDIAQYANVDVQVPLSSEVLIATRNGVFTPSEESDSFSSVTVDTNSTIDYLGRVVENGKLLCPANYIFKLSSDVKDLGDDVLATRFYSDEYIEEGRLSLAEIDLSPLQNATGDSCCDRIAYYCDLKKVNLENLEVISGEYAFNFAFSKTSLTTIELPALRVISGNRACTSMFGDIANDFDVVNLPNLEEISGSYACMDMFAATNISRINFCSLNVLTGISCFFRTFGDTEIPKSIYFYALKPDSFGIRTNQFSGMLDGASNCTVHFPISIQATIGSWASVTSGFGGTNTIVLFDIVQTLTGDDTNTYTRTQKDSTATATAWKYNNTLYYTSGSTEPTVGTKIYSDSVCETEVTTVAAIA